MRHLRVLGVGTGLLVVAAVIFMWVGAPETAGRELDRITTDVPDATTTDAERTRYVAELRAA